MRSALFRLSGMSWSSSIPSSDKDMRFFMTGHPSILLVFCLSAHFREFGCVVLLQMSGAAGMWDLEESFGDC